MIIPAILEKNWEEIEKKLEICREFATNVHIDFIDGLFADNTSFFDFEPFKKYSEYFHLEAHLMVEDPTQYLDDLSSCGFKTFIGHVEKMRDQVEFVAKGEALGYVGLALDLDSSISRIQVPLDDLDKILLMTVKAGKSGQQFNEFVDNKIKKLKSRYLGVIEVDGGISEKTLPIARDSGASSFCVTSHLFTENPVKNYRELENLLRD